MACGVHLGILLVVFVRLEHVCCSWASPALSQSWMNAGALQQGVGPRRRVSVSHPGELRQTSTAGLSQRLLTVPEQNGRFVHRSSLFKPTSQATSLVAPEKKPQFRLSSAIVSGSAVSKYGKKQTSPLVPRAFGAGGNVAPEDARRPASQGSGPKPNLPARTRTSASAAGRRVRPHGSASKPSPSSGSLFTGASKLTAQPGFQASHVDASQVLKPGQRFAPTKVHTIPDRFGGFAIRRLGDSSKTSSAGHQAAVSAPQTSASFHQVSRPLPSLTPQNQGLGSSKPYQVSRPQTTSGSTSYPQASRPQQSSARHQQTPAISSVPQVGSAGHSGVSRPQVSSTIFQSASRPQTSSATRNQVGDMNKFSSTSLQQVSRPQKTPIISNDPTRAQTSPVYTPQGQSSSFNQASRPHASPAGADNVLKQQWNSARLHQGSTSRTSSGSTSRQQASVPKPLKSLPSLSEVTESTAPSQMHAPVKPKTPKAHHASKWIKYQPPFGQLR